MKNTPENKAKFFALYWGQEVLKRKCSSTNFAARIGTELPIEKFILSRPYFLELKPLSQITDEDAIEVDRLRFNFRNHAGKSIIGKNYIATSANKNYMYSIIVDFLRSKGYALPYMGISVEQQIKWDWIKLKEGKS